MTERSLAELAGHDVHAQRRLVALLERHRREGFAGLRAAVADLDDVTIPEIDALIVEAVLTIAEQRSRPMGSRRAWEDFETAEAADEVEQIRRGGGR